LKQNPSHIFRMTHKNNIDIFIEEGYLYALNHKYQKQYAISYQGINTLRSTMQVFNGKYLHDYVAFYFSPLTPMSYAISKGKVELRDLDNNLKGMVDKSDVIYFVISLDDLASLNYETIVSNSACNNFTFETFKTCDETGIDWSLFNEAPIKGNISEIDYYGSCRYIQYMDQERYQNRSAIRGAEFLVLDKIKFSDINIIVVNNEKTKIEIKHKLNEKGIDKVVLVKPDCYY